MEKIFKNHQQFFIEELYDASLLSYNLAPKEHRNRNSSTNLKKLKDKKLLKIII